METLKTENSVTSMFLTKLLKKLFCYEVYSFELNLLIIHLRNYEAFFFALCLYLQKNIEIWCLILLLKTGNIVHELVTESFTNQKKTINNRTRTTFLD